MIYTNIGKGSIEIRSLRDVRGNHFRLSPNESVDISRWPAANVAAHREVLARYVRNRELVLGPRPAPVPARTTRRTVEKKETTE